MNLFALNEKELLGFLLVFLRTGTFLSLWPILGSANIPRQLKVLISLAVASILFPLVAWQKLQVDLQSAMLVWLVIKEIAVALVLVFMCHLIFQAVQICGEIISITMGLSSAQTFNPVSASRESVIGQFQVLLVSAFFLAIQGHHLFFSGLVESFQLVPIGLQSISLISGADLAYILQKICTIGLQLSAPVLAALFFSNLAMAIIGRAVPQINILVTSFPINILLGFLIMIVSIPAFLYGFKSSIDLVMGDLFRILKSM